MRPDLPDLRLPLLGLAAWAGGLAGRWLPWQAVTALGLLGLALLVVPRCRRPTGVAALLVLGAVAVSALLRSEQVAASPVASLAAERAVAEVELRITSDPRLVAGRYGERVLLRATTTAVSGRGETRAVRTPVLVLADDRGWLEVPLGGTVRLSGVLSPSDDPGLAAVVSARAGPEVLAGPDVWWRAASAVRASIRQSVAHRPSAQAALVPALVVGDDALVAEELADDFRTTGLTHLLAVSGTNLTLVVGFLLVSARAVGVRGRWLHLVAAAGIAGFVLLARTEPSVVRAAAMGAVGLFAMGPDGRRRGARALGAAVVGLLLVEPALAVSVGFALSVTATAGIVLLGPAWRDALAHWLPRWAAEAIAVPATAQLACTPLVAALSGQVSLVAVVANLLAAPAVGPATVLGLAAGLVGLVLPALGELLGSGAGLCVGWIVLVAEHGAGLPGAAVGWGTDVLALGVLSLLAASLVVAAPRLLRTAWGVQRAAACSWSRCWCVHRAPAGLPGAGW